MKLVVTSSIPLYDDHPTQQATTENADRRLRQNNYQNEQSEKWIGEWVKERKIRDQLVIATK